MHGLSGAPARLLAAVFLLGAVPFGPALALPAAGGRDAPQPPAPSSPPAQAAQKAPPGGNEPAMADLGLPAYPQAQFLASYSAGRGQQFYLFGTAASFAEVVSFYKAALKQKGELVFDEPGVYVFEVGRFREDTMAFPPGITVKDYSTGRLKGYLNPKPGGQPSRFPTVIQIVPVPPAAALTPKR